MVGATELPMDATGKANKKDATRDQWSFFAILMMESVDGAVGHKRVRVAVGRRNAPSRGRDGAAAMLFS